MPEHIQLPYLAWHIYAHAAFQCTLFALDGLASLIYIFQISYCPVILLVPPVLLYVRSHRCICATITHED